MPSLRPPDTTLWSIVGEALADPDNPRTRANERIQLAHAHYVATTRPRLIRRVMKNVERYQAAHPDEVDSEGSYEDDDEDEEDEDHDEGTDDGGDGAAKAAEDASSKILPGTAMSDDIGLLAPAAAAAEEAAANASFTAAAASIAPQLDNRDPATPEGVVLRINLRTGACMKEPGHRGCIQKNFVNISPMHVPHGPQNKRLYPMEVSAPPEFTFDLACPNSTGVQAYIANHLLSICVDEQQIRAVAARPAVLSRLVSTGAGGLKGQERLIKTELAVPRTSRPTVINKLATLLGDALIQMGVFATDADGCPVGTPDELFKRWALPVVVRACRLVRAVLPIPASAPVTPSDASTFRKWNDLTLGYDAHRKRSFWIVYLPYSAGFPGRPHRNRNISFAVPKEVPSPPEPASDYFHIRGTNRLSSLDDQLSQFPGLAQGPRQAIKNVIGWLDHRRQGQELSHVDDDAVVRASKGFQAFLRSKLTPRGREGRAKWPCAWKVARHYHPNGVLRYCAIRRGKRVWTQPGAGGMQDSTKIVFGTKTDEVAQAAVVLGTDLFDRTADWKLAEREMSHFILTQDDFGIPSEFMDKLLELRQPTAEDEVFTCSSCFEENDIAEIRYAGPLSSFPRDMAICPNCLLEVSSGTRQNPFRTLRDLLVREGSEKAFQGRSPSELEADFKKHWPTVIDESTGLVVDAYTPSHLKLGFAPTNAFKQPANVGLSRAVLDCVGPLPLASNEPLVKHGDMRNIVPTSPPLNFCIQQDPKHTAGLTAIRATLSNLRTSLDFDSPTESPLAKILDFALEQVDEGFRKIVAAAHRYTILYARLAWQQSMRDLLGGSAQLEDFIAGIRLVDQVAEEVILPSNPAIPAIPDEKVAQAAQRLEERNPPRSWDWPHYDACDDIGFDHEDDKAEALKLIEQLRQDLNPTHVFAKFGGGEPSFLHPSEMAQLQMELGGRALTFEEGLREARSRWFRRLHGCNQLYNYADGADALKDLFFIFFIELYLELLLGEGEDALSGPVWLMHPTHSFQGGIGHCQQKKPMNHGHSIPRPQSAANYDLGARNMRRRRWSTRQLIVLLQDSNTDKEEEVRKSIFEGMKDYTVVALKERRLAPVLSSDHQETILKALGNLPEDYDLLLNIRQRGYLDPTKPFNSACTPGLVHVPIAPASSSTAASSTAATTADAPAATATAAAFVPAPPVVAFPSLNSLGPDFLWPSL
ncbi:hypothetical protein JCM11251_000143 [Rhodosporidiobolus azoricus]